MESVQLSRLIDHRNPYAIFSEVRSIFVEYYGEVSFLRIENAFKKTLLLFSGKFRDYLSCDTEYHDLSHTLDAFLSCARLLDGMNTSEGVVPQALASQLLIAALVHDAGYIRLKSDIEGGTGAKYTANHVDRSVEFASRNRADFMIDDSDFLIISSLIYCTGLKKRLEDFVFENENHRKAGAILATADLLGQMSDRAYLEKLLFLYYEFREAGIPGFDTEFDILKKTLDFYEITKKRLDTVLLGVYRYAEIHFENRHGIKQNLYLNAIERHIDYLKKIISDDTTNFRRKLKRIDLEMVDPHGIH